MTYRNLKYLVYNDIFRNFVKKYNFKINISDTILLVSDCIILEIYGFNIEDIVYFDIYIENYKKYTNVGRLCEGKPDKAILDILKIISNTHQEPIIKSNEINLVVALKAEQWFFMYIEIMKVFFDDFLKCNFGGYEQYFTPTFHNKIQLFEEQFKFLILEDIDFLQKNRITQ